jgi:hypothetical protein
VTAPAQEPAPSATIPTYRYHQAPDGLKTYNQLKAVGLRPGGHPVVAQLEWRSRLARGGLRHAWLYDLELAKPVRPMTPAKWRAVHAALRAQLICPACGEDRGYRISPKLGVCVPCHDT